MAKQDERFIKVLNEGSTWTTNREIWVDKTTGVNSVSYTHLTLPTICSV